MHKQSRLELDVIMYAYCNCVKGMFIQCLIIELEGIKTKKDA
jgi:hypothetical protein